MGVVQEDGTAGGKREVGYCTEPGHDSNESILSDPGGVLLQGVAGPEPSFLEQVQLCSGEAFILNFLQHTDFRLVQLSGVGNLGYRSFFCRDG